MFKKILVSYLITGIVVVLVAFVHGAFFKLVAVGGYGGAALMVGLFLLCWPYICLQNMIDMHAINASVLFYVLFFILLFVLTRKKHQK